MERAEQYTLFLRFFSGNVQFGNGFVASIVLNTTTASELMRVDCTSSVDKWELSFLARTDEFFLGG